MTFVRRFWAGRSGSSAAEFGLVLPLLLVMIFLVIDGGRYLWSINRLEKATQWGARYAAVADPVAGGLTTADYVDQTGVGLGQGDTIPASALGAITCTSASCTCTTTPCPATLTPTNSYSFTNIVNRMKLIAPEIPTANVSVIYRGSNLGYAGDPSGMQISPLVTVKVTHYNWQPLSGFTLKNAQYPDIETTLTAEDSVGNSSY